MSHSLARHSLLLSNARSLPFRGARSLFGLLLLLLWALWSSRIDLRLLLSPQVWRSTADLLGRLFPPDLSFEFLQVAWHASLVTAATSLVATFVAAVLALPLAVLASGRLWRSGLRPATGRPFPLWVGLSWCVLHAMGLVRSIPDLVWALLFVAGLGLGPLAGTLALIVSYAALLGRVYADIFDETDKRPLEALQALGATPWQVLFFAILPQSRPLLTSYTLYSFECSIRSAAVLGFVGAGGLGYEIYLSMRLFEFPQVLTLLACFVLLLLLVDVFSRFLRARLQFAAVPPSAHRSRRRGFLAIGFVALLLLCLPVSGVTPASLLQNDTLGHFLRFAGQLLKPDFSPSFLRQVGALALETISISLVGTAGGTGLGFLLALPATRLHIFRPPRRLAFWPGRLPAEFLFWSARLILNVLRAIPEIVWVLICVIAVGFGSFAGAIALGLHTGGVLGKLFAETMEECPRGQMEAVSALGASLWQGLFWVLLPQSWPLMWRYILLRWDMNLRAATILGLVGGGGLGQALYNNVQLAAYGPVSTLILAVVLLVVGTDWLSRSNARSEMLTE